MKILWFPGNGAIYNNDNKYNGGGWTGALARELINHYQALEFGMAIPWSSQMRDVQDGVQFYGIPRFKHEWFNYDKKLSCQVEIIKSIVEDFKPDVIHVFGSEHTGGMVATVTDVPVVLHLQGILNFLKESWLPFNYSWHDYLMMNPKRWMAKRYLEYTFQTERKILKACRYYMGRTEMDRRAIQIYSPNNKYFYCGELLRPKIYESQQIWSYHKRNHRVITSIISSAMYKGCDVILRVAKILQEDIGLDFEWNVYGLQDMSLWEKVTNIKSSSVNVCAKGIINEEQLIQIICESDVYVHSSYVENSPNTVCEAQILGIPVIAHYTGGIPSLLDHMKDGILTPTNNPITMASYIHQLCADKEMAEELGKGGRERALKRHDPQVTVQTVMDIYKELSRMS